MTAHSSSRLATSPMNPIPTTRSASLITTNHSFIGAARPLACGYLRSVDTPFYVVSELMLLCLAERLRDVLDAWFYRQKSPQPRVPYITTSTLHKSQQSVTQSCICFSRSSQSSPGPFLSPRMVMSSLPLPERLVAIIYCFACILMDLHEWSRTGWAGDD